MDRKGYVYFVTNKGNNVLYIGVTNDLLRRVAEHKLKVCKGFSAKYNCSKLVYFEEYEQIVDAISREKQLKNWKREWKNELVDLENPQWDDLSERIGIDEIWINQVRAHYMGE